MHTIMCIFLLHLIYMSKYYIVYNVLSISTLWHKFPILFNVHSNIYIVNNFNMQA